MPVCLHWRRGLQAGSRVCLLGSGVVFWRGFLSVRCLGSGELLMSADRVRHGTRRKRRFCCYILTHKLYAKKQMYKNTYADIHIHSGYVARHCCAQFCCQTKQNCPSSLHTNNYFYLNTSFFPCSFLFISLTNLLLQTASISHTVDLYLR